MGCTTVGNYWLLKKAIVQGEAGILLKEPRGDRSSIRNLLAGDSSSLGPNDCWQPRRVLLGGGLSAGVDERAVRTVLPELNGPWVSRR